MAHVCCTAGATVTLLSVHLTLRNSGLDCFHCLGFVDRVQVSHTVRSGCVPVNAEGSQNCCALHFSLLALTEVAIPVAVKVTFWEYAKRSCTCDPRYLCDDWNFVLRGLTLHYTDKSLEGGQPGFVF